MEKPEIVTDEHLEYLDALRESGIINMCGAWEYIENLFMLSRKEAKEILVYWRKTFTERHPNG